MQLASQTAIGPDASDPPSNDGADGTPQPSEADGVVTEDRSGEPAEAPRLWLQRVSLFHYRNYVQASVEVGPGPVVLIGQNGAGKTNFLEALSLLSPGRGLRRAQFSDLSAANSDGAWSVSARVHSVLGPVTIGTGMRSSGLGATGASVGGSGGERAQRIVRIDGDNRVSSGVLAEYVDMVWLTPAMDSLFTGPASDRRRFLDQLVLCFDASHRTTLNRFERAMQQRNRMLSDGVEDTHILSGLEQIMAETGVALAAARSQAIAALRGVIAARRARDPNSPFPWADVGLGGQLETDLATLAAVDVEDRYLETLKAARARDRGAGRALDGPHRSDFLVGHGPKAMAARLSSTGEQKALLLALVLAHAELVRQRRHGLAPIVLLDEVAAHLDASRRQALFAEILDLNAQAWMTGTDPEAFSGLGKRAQFLHVSEGQIAGQ